jgi:hypothetical protein
MKIKTGWISIFRYIIVSILIFDFACVDEYLYIRPIKLKIIDSKKRKPISGIKIYYSLEAEKPKKEFYFFQNPEGGADRRFIYSNIFYSDNNGEVVINLEKSKFVKDYFTLKEEIYVNLEIIDRLPPYYKDKGGNMNNFLYYVNSYVINKILFFNPKREYRGFYIFNTDFSINPKDWGNPKSEDYHRWDKFDAMYNGKSLLKERESIIVELKRYSHDDKIEVYDIKKDPYMIKKSKEYEETMRNIKNNKNIFTH